MTFSILLTVLLLMAAWFDVKYRRLPNWLAGLILVLGIAWAFFGGGPMGLGSNLLHGAIALTIGFGLFAVGWIGGGDAKTYAALAANFPMPLALSLIALVSIAMLVIALIWLPVSRLRRRARKNNEDQAAPEQGNQDREADDNFAKIPLGIAIAAGGIALIWMGYPAFDQPIF
ncbi:MAG: prepilin peptidase [Erythrobacter sp.]